MKELKNYTAAKVMGESTQIPKGGYIAKIMDCKEVETEKAHYLAFSFDIAEGEYKNHYANQYKTNTNEDKKWKGILNLFIPKESDQYYEENLTRFKTSMSCFEESNKGYHWDWNEQNLKGKLIGIVFGEKEWKNNDGDILTLTEARYFKSIEQIKNNKFKLPNLKKLKETPTNANITYEDVDIDDSDLPF